MDIIRRDSVILLPVPIVQERPQTSPPILSRGGREEEGADRHPGPFLRAWDSIWRGVSKAAGELSNTPMLRDAIDRKPAFPELPANRTYRRHCRNDANDPSETLANRSVGRARGQF